MGILNIEMDGPIAGAVLELVQERIADIRSGVVTGFAWDEATELDMWREAETALIDAGAKR